ENLSSRFRLTGSLSKNLLAMTGEVGGAELQARISVKAALAMRVSAGFVIGCALALASACSSGVSAGGGGDGGGAADAGAGEGGATAASLPLALVADVGLPGGSTRFDYQEI